MQVTAALVKELRERSGAGMMECKNALMKCDGDLDAAFDHLRKSGIANAAKKAGRITAEGTIVIKCDADGRRAVMVEVNSETDFVARDDTFLGFADGLAQSVLNGCPSDLDALGKLPMSGGDGETVEAARARTVSTTGENISIRRFTVLETDSGVIGDYLHGRRIGVLTRLEGGDAALAKDISMHIAASRPMCVSEADIPRDVLEKEQSILAAQVAESGKPAAIVEKIVVGRLRKFIGDVTLLGQAFVKNPDQTIGALLAERGAKVLDFTRYEVGEGLEKRADNFAAEVAAQAKSAS